jgi:hypothetical protein
VIDTDAHSVKHLDFMRYGVFVARRAGLTRDDVLNTRPVGAFRKAIRRTAGPAVKTAKAAPVKAPATKKKAVRKAAPAAGRRASARKARGKG